MALAAGTRFGPYEINAAIGKGGMGEVYQATDTTLEREVAIKVLPESFASDTGRVTRFEQEAKTLASLNHPNIAQIYGLERGGDTTALVMELVEGPTLADRIAKGPLPAEEALGVALQITEGLDAAHAQGIVHRDLKPANIKLRPDGTVKLLDFGIAKALDPEIKTTTSGSQSPLLTTPVTQTGIILGTAAYMSPEQARGLFIDQRTDIWAFGAVLFEMLTGQPAFGGEDVTVTLARVVDRDSDLSALPGAVSPVVKRTIELCLQKNPKDRLHAIGDVRLALSGAFDTRHRSGESGADASGTQARNWLRTLPVAIAAVLLAAVTGYSVWALKPVPAVPVTRFADVLPEGQNFTRFGNYALAVSPDGRRIVYAADRQLFLRDLDAWEALPIAGTDEDVGVPVFSPDGEWIAYYSFSESQLKKISVTGGAPITLTTAENPFGRFRWEDDDQIVWGQSTGVMTVSANGGTPEVLVQARDTAINPQLLPDGKSVLYQNGDFTNGDVLVQDIETGEARTLFTGQGAIFLPTGHIIYGLDNVLFAVPFDLETLTPSGGSVSLVEGVRNNPLQYDISATGDLVYLPGEAGSVERTVALVDRDGIVERLNLPPKEYTSPRISPDGQTLLVQSIEPGGGTLWTYDMSGDLALEQRTFEGDNQKPAWSRDGEYITFSSDRNGTMSLFQMPADGGAPAEQLTTAEPGTSHWMGSWSADNMTILYNVQRQLASNWDIEMLSLADGTTEVLYDEPGTAYFGAELSWDGQFLAYGEGASSANVDIFLEPFPPTGARRRISQTGGYWPLWSGDGNELIYRPISNTPEITLRTVDIVTSPTISYSNEQTHPARGFQVVAYYKDYDLMPDGERLVLIYPFEDSTSGEDVRLQINVVQNWFDEVRERAPLPSRQF